MSYTTQRLVARVYSVLGGFLTQEELYYEDVRDEANAVFAGYVQDQDLAGRDRRTAVEEAEVEEGDIDFLLTVPNVPDFEPVSLEYGGQANATARAYLKATLVPLSAFRYGPGVVASIYGSRALEEGQKVRLSLTPDEVSKLSWRLTFRLPLLNELQMGERPPVPENFMPMLELQTALKCVKLVRSRSEEWKEWKRDNLALVRDELREWTNEEGTGRWQKYLESSVEDPVQPLARSDAHRFKGRCGQPRAHLPRG